MLSRYLSLVVKLLIVSIATRGPHSAILAGTPVGTINICHDLVRLNIASQNLSPNKQSVDARPFFQAAVAYAQQHGIRVLTVDHGSYYFRSPQDQRAYLLISKTPDLTIDLADSTIYLSNAIQSVFLCLTASGLHSFISPSIFRLRLTPTCDWSR